MGFKTIDNPSESDWGGGGKILRTSLFPATIIISFGREGIDFYRAGKISRGPSD